MNIEIESQCYCETTKTHLEVENCQDHIWIRNGDEDVKVQCPAFNVIIKDDCGCFDGAKGLYPITEESMKRLGSKISTEECLSYYYANS